MDDYPRVYTIMREIGKNENEVDKHSYRSWPLFKALRDEAEFQNTFEDIFEEPLSEIRVEEADYHDSVTDDKDSEPPITVMTSGGASDNN